MTFRGSALDHATVMGESGGRRYGSGGGYLRSSAGAMGEWQVMPETARAPGFGIRPWNGAPDDLARVGQEYRQTMERRYGGDLAKMWAAYNWGPGNLDGAIRRRGREWWRDAPPETMDYIRRNGRRVGRRG